ncbi:hypothetical protein O6H91_05G120300 [Diphasiastrum complanatum]|uniref:Uncharacterized protein n=1 Tax=Diphasiastrum complanatum TaxID=34168 RepID=A0ACC2DT64_DIPCM|nr:hypothetical protein O6H91_05G120300 [Diphasiastrum complanatum]
MEWKEVAPAAFVALIFAVVVAKVISLVAPFRKRDHVHLERASATSYYDRVVEPDVLLAKNKTSFLDLSVAEKKTRSSDLSVPEESYDSRQSLSLESRFAGSAEESAYEDNTHQSSTVIERLATEDAGSKKFEVTQATSSRSSEVRDGRGDIILEAETTVDDESLKQSIEDDIDDWEGVESTELEEAFGAAANYVAKLAAEQRLKVSNDVQLQLYALYKLATEGPCSSPQPSALKISSRAKWNAWQKLGVVEPEEAMLEYIKKVSDINPTWNEESQKTRKQLKTSLERSGDISMERGPMGPVFSTLATNDDHEGDGGILDAIHAYARDGDDLSILKVLDCGTPVDLKDDEGRTALHWAADRGRLHIVKTLVSKGAEIQAKDQEGQTPLHYAAACEQEAIAQYLVQHCADPLTCDNEGVTPLSCCPTSWIWMTSKT